MNKKKPDRPLEKRVEELERELEKLKAEHIRLEGLVNDLLNHKGEIGRGQMIVKIGMN